MKKVGLIVRSKQELIYKYLEATKSLHRLTGKEIEVLTEFILTYLDLKEKVLDEELLYKLLFSGETRSNIMEKTGVVKSNLSVIEKKFNKIGIFKDGKINKAIIPNIKDGVIDVLFRVKLK